MLYRSSESSRVQVEDEKRGSCTFNANWETITKRKQISQRNFFASIPFIGIINFASNLKSIHIYLLNAYL